MSNKVNIEVQNNNKISVEVLSGNNYSDLYIIFDKKHDEIFSITFNEIAGRFDTTKKILTNISSVDSIKLNGSNINGLFRIDNGDTLAVAITRLDNTLDSKIQFEAQ
jgi:hypothetical protein